MKVFLISCAVAALIAVGSIYVLNDYQQSAETAYASKSGVRL